MRDKPFTATTPAPEPAAAEPTPETPAPSAPEPQKAEKSFLQKYGWLLIVAVGIALIYFFMKYQIVPKVAAAL